VGPSLPIFTQDLGVSAQFMMGASQWAPSFNTQGYDRFVKSEYYAEAFEERYDLHPSYLSAGATTCGILFENAINQVQSLDPTTVRDSLAKTNTQTMFGPVKFDQHGLNSVKPVATIQLINSGSQWDSRVIWPKNMVDSHKPAVWPFPGWSTKVLFDESSLFGNYWFRKVGGSAMSDDLGTMHFDGSGNFDGNFVINNYGTITYLCYTGTYVINFDGTGVFNWQRAFTNGTKETLHSHVVAMKSKGSLITTCYSSIDLPMDGTLSGRIIERIDSE